MNCGQAQADFTSAEVEAKSSLAEQRTKELRLANTQLENVGTAINSIYILLFWCSSKQPSGLITSPELMCRSWRSCMRRQWKNFNSGWSGWKVRKVFRQALLRLDRRVASYSVQTVKLFALFELNPATANNCPGLLAQAAGRFPCSHHGVALLGLDAFLSIPRRELQSGRIEDPYNGRRTYPMTTWS